MPFDFTRARPLLQRCDFKTLFVEELGWEPCRKTLTLRAEDVDFTLTAFAEKRGFVGWLCKSAGTALPDHNTRLKLDRALAQTSFEHLVVFVTQDGSRQSWMWVRREPGRPLRPRTHDYDRNHPGDALLQKLQRLYVSIEEEETGGLSTVGMSGRARQAFDVERITKKFFDQFKKEHAVFLGFIQGIPVKDDAEWYASVMLNRMMFVYFIQRKGFLDGDSDYLRNRLARCRQEKGRDKFYSFYRYFLLRLFHEGFSQRRKDRAPDLETLLGNIPYLNGGMFDVHELEKPDRYGREIQIADDAFERVFDYFDRYDWVLDPERTVRKPGDREEINPDVLGYIFEKYINQKQMGAYYTKEDITEYISKNTLLPFLFDSARQECKAAFEYPGGPTVWDLLCENPDRYIYPAVRHGVDKPLPPEIAAGLNPPGLHDPVPEVNRVDDIPAIRLRKAWNKPAPPELGLPTEIWREVVARRKRYWELREKLTGAPSNPDWVANPPPLDDRASVLECGSPLPLSHSPHELKAPEDRRTTKPCGIRDINDIITLNLDIRQFAQDVIEHAEGPALLRAFWRAIAGGPSSHGVTVLDPTCGSGAFLFAALNILEPLYEACLDRMEAFLQDEAAQYDRAKLRFTERGYPLLPHKKFEDFSLLLDRVAAHPNRRYFIFKSIILNNLFGVDIMEEAVEICKLRLFLKLAAHIDADPAKDNLGIEPLPDIDFNIRAGNTLVGYATAQEVQRCMREFGGGQMRLGVDDELNSYVRFAEKVELADRAFRQFREMQTERGMDAKDFFNAKQTLRERLKALKDELNRHLASDYGVIAADESVFEKWLKTHQPFHWFVEFYGIVSSGSFDAIIGNPPYVEYRDVRSAYTLRNYAIMEAGNLFAFVMERSLALLRRNGRFGMIVPLSVVCTERTACVQVLLRRFQSHVSHYSGDRNPAEMFDGVKMRLTICLIANAPISAVFCSRYRKWFTAARPELFPTLSYGAVVNLPAVNTIPKTCDPEECTVLSKLIAHKPGALSPMNQRGFGYYFHNAPIHWVRAFSFAPYFWSERDGEKVSDHYRQLLAKDQRAAKCLIAILNSSLFYCWFVWTSNCRDLTAREINAFPFDPTALSSAHTSKLTELTDKLMKDYRQIAEVIEVNYKATGKVRYEQIDTKRCKHVIDEIDRVLARHYGFTAEELDFIIHYDIKYRLGRDTENEEG